MEKPITARADKDSRFFIGLFTALPTSIIVWLLLLWLFWGCATIPEERFHKVITIQIEFHLVSDRDQFDYELYKSAKMGVTGYANTDGKIYVVCKKEDGVITCPHIVLGHELSHLLNWKDPAVLNPDEDKQ